MKYMLMMNTPRDGYDQYLSWPKKDLEANTAFMIAFTNKLAALNEPANERLRWRSIVWRQERPPAFRNGTTSCCGQRG